MDAVKRVDGVFELSRYVDTTCNQTRDSRSRAGPSTSPRPFRGASSLVPGTSLTSLDDDALEIFDNIREQRHRR
ncbi:hypothetical protein ANAPRD1_01350 [Anaplasma phagocytophilum]|uniref:hypothetical protein n=1 Tax=Anaplasma phagocytophilum TaxID=948 RepID=UPI0007E27C09|nr:hypothetical protein [Anaplasma phagocytophilum]SCV62645.1 hypothetical protein ANAPH1_00254 [Anaplasma phagocytophilum]SCV66833.1 hypothetical protein ANAPRD1_01350 [Anaplasma phagocytophilum]